jgi:hypothetical protein
MADRKISDLTALTTPASGDYLPIVDISESAAASKNKRITVEELMRGAPNGTAAAPSIAFESDPNTGIYIPGADQLAISTNGSGRVFVDSTGLVGLGISSPGASLHVNNIAALSSVPAIGSLGGLFDSTVGLSNYGLISGALNSGAYFFQSQTTDGTSATYPILLNPNGGAVGIGTTTPGETLSILGSTSTVFVSVTKSGTDACGIGVDGAGNHIGSGGIFAFRVGGFTSSDEKARIDTSGRLLVGTSTARSNFYNTSFANSFQIEGAGSSTTTLSLTSNNSSTVGQEGTLVFAKSNGDSGGSNVLVSTGNPLGRLSFQGNDGTEFVEAACIQAFVDGTPGTDDMPGRLVFSTTADGAATPTERLRITSAGVLQVADAGDITVGTTTGTKIGTGTTQKLGFYNATPVVQPTAVADATDAASAITQLNALLTRMRNLGLIAT